MYVSAIIVDAASKPYKMCQAPFKTSSTLVKESTKSERLKSLFIHKEKSPWLLHSVYTYRSWQRRSKLQAGSYSVIQRGIWVHYPVC